MAISTLWRCRWCGGATSRHDTDGQPAHHPCELRQLTRERFRRRGGEG